MRTRGDSGPNLDGPRLADRPDGRPVGFVGAPASSRHPQKEPSRASEFEDQSSGTPRLYRGSEGSRASRRARAGASSNCCLQAAQKLRAHRTRLKRGSRGGRSGQLRCYARHLGWLPLPRAVGAAQNTVWSTQQKPQQTRLPQQYGCCCSATVVCDGSPGCRAHFRDDDKI